MVEDEEAVAEVHHQHKFHSRDHFLPDERQGYFEFPGVRPDRGPCPECKVAEADYCLPHCTLVDPHAADSAERLDRCTICTLVSVKRSALHQQVILNRRRTVRHLVEAGWGPEPGFRSLCHMVSTAKDGLVVRGVRW